MTPLSWKFSSDWLDVFTSKSIPTSLSVFLHPKKSLLWRCTGIWYSVLFIESLVCFIIGYCFHISLNSSFGFALRCPVFAQSMRWYLCSLKPLFRVIVGPRTCIWKPASAHRHAFPGSTLDCAWSQNKYVWCKSCDLCMVHCMTN